MTNDERRQHRLNAQQERLDMSLHPRSADIDRVAAEGPDGSEEDFELVRLVFNVVGARIHLRNADILSESGGING